MKRIGILTSGGDCAGLNAAIRSIFYRAKKYGMEVVGIKDGTLGLIQRPVNSIELNYEIVSGALFREGGTFMVQPIKEILFILRARMESIQIYPIKLLKVISY